MTTQTQSLSDWLLAQLDADEAVARACHDHEWSESYPGSGTVSSESDRIADCCDVSEGAFSAGKDEVANSRHIAANDPAHVLATVAAHRTIVGIHRPITLGDYDHCGTCDQTGHTWPPRDGPNYEPFPCQTLLTLASIYADRSGYQEAWR